MKQPKRLICFDPAMLGESLRSLRAWRKTLLRWRRDDPDDLSVDWALESVDEEIQIRKEESAS